VDRDPVVAEAWEQPGWADYSGVSRTLSGLSWDEAHQVVDVLQQVSQPFVEAEIQQVVWQGQRLCLDGDLTGIPVSNTSRTYPNAAFPQRGPAGGHMNNEIRLGYQAALVSLESPTYGRLWLSVAHHPGDTVSCTQGEALVSAAEARIGVRPRRQTEWLRQRLQVFQEQLTDMERRLQAQHQAVAEAQARLATACQQERERQAELNHLEQHYQARRRQERPTSYQAKARQRFQAVQRRRSRREQTLQEAQRRQAKTRARLAEQQAELARLQERLERFEQDNADNGCQKAGARRCARFGRRTSGFKWLVVTHRSPKGGRFSGYSALAGKVLKLPGGRYSPPPAPKFVIFVPFLIESHLIAQPLR
jgi:hypothetical protein